MARHLHAVRDHRELPRRREVEAGITRGLELVACALAGLAAPVLHAKPPALPPRRRRSPYVPAAGRSELDVA